jgi:Fic family protein
MDATRHTEILSAVDYANAELKRMRPLSATTLESLRRALRVEMVCESNAIEGSTLTLSETKVVLEDGLTVSGKSLREHMEAVDHAEAFDMVYRMASGNEPIDEYSIKALHSAVMRRSDPAQAGQYRRENVFITGAGFTPPDSSEIPLEMVKLFEWYQGESELLHPVSRAAQLHARFVGIHPFRDGNGRTARLLMNLQLLRDQYPWAILRSNKRLEYIKGLDEACSRGCFDPFVKVVANAILETVQQYRNLNNPPRPRWKRG